MAHVRSLASRDTMGEAAPASSPMPPILTSLRDRLFRQERRSRFEEEILPHVDAAYDLARWLTRNDADAEDVVQTALLRALQFFAGFHGVNAKAWLLTIVRNTFYTWLEQKDKGAELAAPFDETLHSAESSTTDPEVELLRQADSRLLSEGFAALPLPFREAIVLRELEGLSYKEIAAVVGVPIGTVMSRLARGRRQLQEFLLARGVKETGS